MPTGNEDINAMVQWAVDYCNDETHGYSQPNRADGGDIDCSGLVWCALYHNGWAMPCGLSDWYTGNMMAKLEDMGFTRYRVPHGSSMQLQHGDILVHREGTPSDGRGHAYIYAENVYGYTNTASPNYYYSSTKGLCTRARVEALGNKFNVIPNTDPKRYLFDHPEAEDQANPQGVHIEVICHASNSFFYGTYTWNVFRWGGAPPPPGPHPVDPDDAGVIAAILLNGFTSKRRKGRR